MEIAALGHDRGHGDAGEDDRPRDSQKDRAHGTGAIVEPIDRAAGEDVSARRALAFAARKTKAAADAATQRAADAAAQEQGSMRQGEITGLQAARQNAAVEQASQVAAVYSPAKKKQTTLVPTAQAPVPPGIPPQCPAPTAAIQAPIPAVTSSVEGMECQKFLYEVANQTARSATAQMAAAENLATNARDTGTRQEAEDQATKAQKNMGLAKQMAEAAQSPAVAVQAVAAIQKACSNKHES
ncbi:hypothetical protein SELMODRAFT_429705 [Selaginella moellendorffii]|uniref:Uncharacterized protein n=1 Tax=Selaginella moellendorffii TaxID=88036 RepID=D8T714_SELML|nr:uncharacterized protein LOC9639546 [Selaginella moellendorffii]XP_024520964.1 uncharacterized protein LOC9639546 [Selaginella moellendorffii]EFJ07479.1 hypothetical protein SELMODRAFT_429705 [Selaginella moellendorffii]|eukprot:XP_002991367.1 uncharacterized protein LOC9639546 [Selaginella moellendorffii]